MIRIDFLIASLVAFIYAALPWPADTRPPYFLLAGAAVALSLVSAYGHPRAVFSASLLTTFTATASMVDSRYLPWPASFALPLAVYALLVWRVPVLRSAAPRVERGEVGARIWCFVLAIAAVSSTALVLWKSLLRPDLRDLETMLPDQPLVLLLLGGFGFALLNAFLEEAVFRVVFVQALESVASARTAVLIQAFAFGALHLHGFPRGVVGVALATIYGLMLGALRVRAKGMLAVYVAHVLADLTIFAILLAWTRG